MRKLLLFVSMILLVGATATAARLDLPLGAGALGAGWDSSYDDATKTITYTADWSGRGWWLTDADYSAYDAVTVEFEATDSRLQVVIEYNNDIASTTVGVDAGGTVIYAALSAEGKASVKQIYLQKATAGTVVLKAAYLEGDAPAPNYNLSLANLGSGWDSSYDAASKTITYTGAWGGRGWWLEPSDFSMYKDVVVNFVANAATVKLVVEYSDGTANTPDVYANAGATSIKVELDAAKSASVKQIYLQLETATTLVLESAYLTPKATATDHVTRNSVYYADNTLYLPANGDVQVVDMSGRARMQLTGVSSVDMSALSTGMYIVRATIDGTTQIVKMLK